jgi:hypothetical protein
MLFAVSQLPSPYELLQCRLDQREYFLAVAVQVRVPFKVSLKLNTFDLHLVDLFLGGGAVSPFLGMESCSGQA